MRIPVHAQTEEVAGGRNATSAQPPHATLVPATKVSSPPTPHPIRSSSLLDTPGALLEGLRCYPLSARSRKRRRFVGKPLLKPRNSR
jgi:hypothetical protein